MEYNFGRTVVKDYAIYIYAEDESWYIKCVCNWFEVWKKGTYIGTYHDILQALQVANDAEANSD